MSDVIGRSSDVGSVDLQQVLDADDAEDVVEVLLVDGEPRVLLIAEERAQLRDGRVRLDRDHVGARRHDLARERVAEIDDRLQQAPLVPLDQPLLLARFEVGVRDFSLVLFALLLRRDQTLGASARQQTDQTAGDRRHRARDDAERRQQRGQDRFRVPAHDERRNQVLAEHDVDGDRGQERGERAEGQARAPRHHGEEHRREREDQPEQEPRRHEELDGIVEVVPEAVVTAALRHQAQGQLHEGAERRLDGAHVDGRHAEQEERERNHGLDAPARSIRPARRPPLARSRRSRRAIRPPSAGSW